MRPEQLDEMIDLARLHKKSFLDVLHHLNTDLHSQKGLIRDNLDQFASVIVPYMVYCYVPGLPDEIPIVHLVSAEGGPRWLFAYPKENIQHFDPVVHFQAIYEGIRHTIVDLAEERTGKNCHCRSGHIMPEITQYWPGGIVQILSNMLGDEHNSCRNSRDWTSSPDLKVSLERTVEPGMFSDRGLTSIRGDAHEKK